jgi:hypothetical protein
MNLHENGSWKYWLHWSTKIIKAEKMTKMKKKTVIALVWEHSSMKGSWGNATKINGLYMRNEVLIVREMMC